MKPICQKNTNELKIIEPKSFKKLANIKLNLNRKRWCFNFYPTSYHFSINAIRTYKITNL